MKKLLTLSAVFAMFVLLSGCATVEQDLQSANSLLLSSKEVREIFQGNTVTAATGEIFYWDASGAVIGKGSYGGVIKGNWNITDDGRLCASNWNSGSAPGGCYKVYFDNTTQLRKLVDLNGDLKYTVLNVVTGNPNNF
ncbi:MAG: hypothetical protein A2X79_03765 [Desulfuromonadaceae bacterium GWB2_53_15]|nr:MAG: hypothetical protein A2X83_10715 [Desulfuromonadales bacterium GWD2_54_10]OHB24702.1 MAG: hypothetical protein A2X79_03765 [Desulfuromonadaceae bacterium GWB2_53_15]